MLPARSPKKLRLWQTSRGYVKLAVEGNIAAGKSTFLNFMSEEGGLKMCPEPVLDWTNIKLDKEVNQNADNNLLGKFYHDPKRWALTFQNYALFSRVKNQPKLDFQDQGIYLCERSVFSDRLIFGKNGLKTNIMTPMEYSLYCKWHTFLTDTNSDTDVSLVSSHDYSCSAYFLLIFIFRDFISLFSTFSPLFYYLFSLKIAGGRFHIPAVQPPSVHDSPGNTRAGRGRLPSSGLPRSGP